MIQFSKFVLNAAFMGPCAGFSGRSKAEEETDTGRERHMKRETHREREMRMNVKEND